MPRAGVVAGSRCASARGPGRADQGVFGGLSCGRGESGAARGTDNGASRGGRRASAGCRLSEAMPTTRVALHVVRWITTDNDATDNARIVHNASIGDKFERPTTEVNKPFELAHTHTHTHTHEMNRDGTSKYWGQGTSQRRHDSDSAIKETQGDSQIQGTERHSCIPRGPSGITTT